MRSTTHPKKLIAAIVLHRLPAFAVANVSTMSLNDIISIKQGRKRMEEDGPRYCGFQMMGYNGRKPGRSTLYRQ